MRYTVWSRGRQLGETDLGFAFRYNGLRCGWFHPTECGDRLLPIATAVSPALEWEIEALEGWSGEEPLDRHVNSLFS